MGRRAEKCQGYSIRTMLLSKNHLKKQHIVVFKLCRLQWKAPSKRARVKFQ